MKDYQGKIGLIFEEILHAINIEVFWFVIINFQMPHISRLIFVQNYYFIVEN